MVDLLFAGGRLLAAFLLVAANGFFVAAEFAFVRVRGTAVDQFREEGRPGSKHLAAAMDHLDDYLAVTQLGITIASIGLGWIGEPAVAALIEPLLGAVLPAGPIHLISFVLGFGFVTFLHVVFGELAPKTISIAEAERVALLVAPPMHLCYRLFIPGVVVFNGTANFFTRLIGVPPASETEETLSEHEIRAVLAHAGTEGRVDDDEVEMIERVFDLDDLIVREVMIPRPDVVAVSATLTVPDLVDRITTAGHTRYPVLDADGETIVGYIDAKDVLEAATGETATERTAGDLARELPAVPEAAPLDDVLRRFQTERRQMVAVIDEWGAFEGIVTVEDVMEQVVGELWDAFDQTQPHPIERRPDGGYIVDATTPVSQCNDELDTGFEPTGAGTIGGLVLDELGRVPSVGDELTIEGHHIEVLAVTENRIGQLLIRPRDPPRTP